MDRDRKQKLLVASELAGSRFNQITNTLLVHVRLWYKGMQKEERNEARVN